MCKTKRLRASNPSADSLQSKIVRALIQCSFDDKLFLPGCQFENLITKTSIEDELRLTGQPSNLSEEIFKKSRKVFAILVYIGMVKCIGCLCRIGLTNERLPVQDDESEIFERCCPKHEWTLKNVQDFIRDQWIFQSPTFGECQGHKLHKLCPLPLIECKRISATEFSEVYRAKIHPSHISISMKEKINYVAIKKLSSTDEQSYTREWASLTAARGLDNKNLIKVIDTFQRDEYFFIFPWAEGGDLREFWKTYDRSKLHESKLIQWTLEQIHGLSRALVDLHDFKSPSGQELFGRHGDLKPENMLLFGSKGELGHIQIADLGLGKFHHQATGDRQGGTETESCTRMYESPESDTESTQPRSRKYDVWSLGCIFLEFVIWALRGFDGVEEFKRHRAGHSDRAKYSRFFVITKTRQDNTPLEAAIHPVVRLWIDEIYKDPRCDIDTALRDLVTVIDKKLLQVKVNGDGNRIHASELSDELEKIVSRAKSDPLYLFNMASTDSLSPNPGPPRETGFRQVESVLAPPTPFRAGHISPGGSNSDDLGDKVTVRPPTT